MSIGATSLAALTRRELIRLMRQPSRVISTLGTAVMFWIIAASGFADSFVMPGSVGSAGATGPRYAAFVLPGMAMMVVVFSSVLAAISLIQDRQAGFLQSALVSPAPTWAIIGSKVLGGTIIAGAQGGLLLLAAPMAGARVGVLFPVALLVLALSAVAVIALGLAAAWRINSVGGFHGVMNLVLLPLWALSGALFPVRGASPWLRAAVEINPMHWSVNTIGACLGVAGGPTGLGQWAGVVLFPAAMLTLAWLVMRGRTAGTAVEGES